MSIRLFFFMIGTAVIGSFLSVKFAFFIPPFVSMIAAVGLMFWLMATPQQEVSKRFGLLLGFGFLKGMSIGPLLSHSLRIDPTLISTAFFSTALIFACFSAAAMFSTRRSFIFLGGMLGSCLSMLFWISLLQLIWPSKFGFDILLYGGLVMFSGYVIFDTQIIIERASQGVSDPIGDALTLFIDLFAMFVRILIILSKNKKKE